MKKIVSILVVIFMIAALSVTSVACGGDDNGGNNDGNTNGNGNQQSSTTNTIDWNGNFFGVELPQVANHNKVCEYSESTSGDALTVRIDGVTYDEYKSYCRQLEALTGWEADDDENAASFPEDYNSRSKVYFTGAYLTLPHVSVQYYSDKTCQNNKYPHFVMFVYKTW
ncbi:MAG: hypothetical protein J5903_02645 [Clostridia bacterium]|nr:hypothetical protein [Clostridia bacterium]